MDTRTAKKLVIFRLDENLINKLKENAKKENRSLNDYVECILMNSLYKEQAIEISDEVPEDFHRAISVDEAKQRMRKSILVL